MKILHSIPLRRKMTLIIMIISTVSLILASTAFITIDRINARQTVTDNLDTIANIIAANSSAAILFGDREAARENLGFLKELEHIQAAAILGPDDTVFASYGTSDTDAGLPEYDHHHNNILFWDDHIDLFTDISHAGDLIGTVYIRSDMSPLHQRYAWYLGIVGIVLLTSLLVAFFLGARMLRIITEPLLRLSDIARQISTEKNYSLRVYNHGKDEVGNLILDFNAMLDEIQSRDKELEANQIQLEDRVTQRTMELNIANLELEKSRDQAESVARRMEYHAHHDALTGLPNRILLHDRITTELTHAHRRQTLMALLFLDLDRFKIINDSLGHAIGDQLLSAISGRIRNCVREEDTVARLGGDEFMVLLPHISSSSDAGRISEKVINALDEPFTCNGNELHITASIGISIYPFDGTDTETLIKNADIAMYRAKELGRNKTVYYTAEMDAEARKKLVLETSLRGALDRNELILAYQPKIDITGDRIVGLEALLRWQHPTMGMISPGDFIPVAEDSGLIVPIGEWVLQTAFKQLAKWHSAGHTDLTIAANLSSAQLSSPALEKVIDEGLSQSGIDGSMVELEITENVAMQNIESAITTLEKLKRKGISIAMDDFGTGYSSLSYLRRLPVDSVKIDRSFVSEIPESKEDILIAQAIIAMAQSLNLSLVVEGVENTKQLHFFRQQGCRIFQGYLFSKPVGADEVLEILESRTLTGSLNLVN